MNSASRIAITLVFCLATTPSFAANFTSGYGFNALPSYVTLAAAKSDKEDDKAAKEAEKEAEKAAKEAAKEAEKAAKEAEKAAEEAAKEAEKAAKEAEKAAEEAAKEAEKAAKEAEKAAEEAAKEAGKDAEEDAEEVAGDDVEGPADQTETSPDSSETTGPSDVIGDIIDVIDDVLPSNPDKPVDDTIEADTPSVPEVTVPLPPVDTPPLTGDLNNQVQEIREKLDGVRSQIAEHRDAESILKLRRLRGEITQEEYKTQIRALREQEAFSVLKMKKLKKSTRSLK